MADQSEAQQIEARLKSATRKLHELAPLLGAAKQVREFSSDQRKNALAKAQRRYLERGEGAAGSEALARSDPLYLEALKALAESHTEAERVIAEWTATMASYDAARSLLAMQREGLKILEG
jgi:hypothetical protein